MEFAKNLAQWRDQSPEQWTALANRILPPVVVTVIVVLIALEAVDLTWRLLESPAEPGSVPPAVIVTGPGAGGSPGRSLAALDDWRPFGQPPAPAEQGVPAADLRDSPETTLPLTLHGALQVQELPDGDVLVVPEAGTAVISGPSRQQKTYRTGEAIDEASGAVLRFVFADSVRLDRGGGRLETLKFPVRSAGSANAAGLNSRIAATPQRTTRPAQAAQPASVFDTMSSIGNTLAQHMTIAAHTENGQTVGYRLQPRGDGQVFSQLGLEPGDVLTEVNGTRLDNINNTMQIIQALGEAPQASVTIRRNDVDQAMVLDMSQLERLAQSLQ